MKIIEIKVMRGPNYWSNYRKKLIVMKIDIGDLEEKPTHLIEGFAERLERCIPSLNEHRCSPGVRGGFFQRVRKGTWMGHVVEHIALELQSLAGMECGFGRTRSTHEKGVYHVVFAYELEKAGIYAAKAATAIALQLANGEEYTGIEENISELSRIARRGSFGPSTGSIIEEATKRNIPYTRMDGNSLVMLGQGCHQKIICATVAITTSSIGVDLAGDKERTKQVLSRAFVPVPEGVLVQSLKELDEAVEEIQFPLVIKPVNGNHGRGITTNIQSREQAQKAFELAQRVSTEVIVERFIQGYDYRFLVVNYKLVAVAKRQPAMVMGDAHSTIAELIEEANRDPSRGEGHEKTLTSIKIDEAMHAVLAAKNLNIDSVLPIGEIVFLRDTANISTGGTSSDVTAWVHPQNVFLAERIARLMHLDICGIDVMAENVHEPITEKTGAVLEVNAGPGFRMHLAPSKGLARNVAKPVVDMLFPANTPARIPIVAVTGTNGKTTTTRLIAHLAKQTGHSVGFTTTEGIYLNEHMVRSGDCSGPSSASIVLSDPLVDFAVLECARGGILRSGLGFDQCDISIITNISEDHLGLNDIHTLEELARVKAVVTHSTKKDGYAILNADDDLVYATRKGLQCDIALFSMDAGNSRVKAHCEEGGMAAVVEDGYFTLYQGKWKTQIAKVTDVPLSFEGRAEFMMQNILPAILAASISNFKQEVILAGLRSFIPSPENTPGRMNVFRFRNFTLMIDYMHNTGGFMEMEKYLARVDSPYKVGIISATGDRRDEDIRNLGVYAARMFNEIIIRHDMDCRGREKDELTRLITEGIVSVNPEVPIMVISNEREAVQYAMDTARQDAFIVACADKVSDSIDFVRKALEQENEVRVDDLNMKIAL